MNVLIIEDEQPAYNRLEKMLKELVPDVSILAHKDSVSGARKWLQNNPAPEIVFMDIHLADGSAFDLLEEVEIKAPVIFTTAYDEYAIDAFKVSGMGYLLKPIKKAELSNAIDKLDSIKKIFNISNDQKEQLLDSIKPEEYKKRFMIRFGDNIKTVPTSDIAYFYSENKATFAKTFDGKTYPIDYNLEGIEKIVDPDVFFRINRQYIISLDAIAEMKTYSKARVLVKLNPEVKEPPLVSSERSAGFKLWLGGEV